MLLLMILGQRYIFISAGDVRRMELYTVKMSGESEHSSSQRSRYLPKEEKTFSITKANQEG